MEKLVITGFICLWVILFVFQSEIKNELNRQSEYYIKEQEELKVIQLENQDIRNEILFLSSYTMIASKAAQMGFIKERSVIWLK